MKANHFSYQDEVVTKPFQIEQIVEKIMFFTSGDVSLQH